MEAQLGVGRKTVSPLLGEDCATDAWVQRSRVLLCVCVLNQDFGGIWPESGQVGGGGCEEGSCGQ